MAHEADDDTKYATSIHDAKRACLVLDHCKPIAAAAAATTAMVAITTSWVGSMPVDGAVWRLLRAVPSATKRRTPAENGKRWVGGWVVGKVLQLNDG